MTATYPYVTIGGQVYETLAELDFVQNYLAADPDGAAFLALTEDAQGQRIVLASRVVSSRTYGGRKTDPDQLYAFLRTGLVPRLPTAVLSTGLVLVAALSFTCGLVLDSVARGRKEIKRLAYLAIPPAPPLP